MLRVGPRPVAAPEEVRRANLGRLMRLLHADGPATRSELATATGLNRSTIKALTEELAGAGLIDETGTPRGGAVGRPSLTVALRPRRTQVVALDVGVQHLAVLRVGLGGTVLSRRRVACAPGDLGVRAVVRRLARLATTAIDDAQAEGTCLGVAVGVCGVVDGSGRVRFAPNLGWVDVPLAQQVAEALEPSLPVVLGNDGDLGALAEHTRGAARGCGDLVYLTGEVGVGGGVILGGRPLRGAGGFAGEVGHMSVDPRGRACRCGRRGCWETEVGEAAVLASTAAPAGMALADVVRAHLSGERWTRAGMNRVGLRLGQGVVNLVNVLNPELVVLGGSLAVLWPAVADGVLAHLEEALAAPRASVRLALAQLGDDATAVGAAEVAFGPLLDDPLAHVGGNRPVRAG